MQLILPNKIKGFTLIEVLWTILLVSLTTGGFFYLYHSAETSRLVSIAKAEVQSEVRRAMDCIVNDVRQTVSWSIGSKSNNPLSTHIKFQRVAGYNTSGSGSATLGNFIEYTFDPDADTITRTDLGTNQSFVFRNIIQVSFSTRIWDVAEQVYEEVAIDPMNPGEDSPLFTSPSANLVIDIRGQKQIGASNINYNLKQETAIRI